ncbi:hypothetical protein [Nocardia sp. NBC_00511]|uniref:hypothetical protein n=1 Tax=Nocardia sp. NBC_00511 TaxID=2903591 RepID=UPI0030E57B33
MSVSKPRRLALRIAAAGALVAIPLAVVALPATANAATPDNAPANAQAIDWHDGHHHHHHGDGGWNNNNGWDNNNGWNNGAPVIPGLPGLPSTGSA